MTSRAREKGRDIEDAQTEKTCSMARQRNTARTIFIILTRVSQIKSVNRVRRSLSLL